MGKKIAIIGLIGGILAAVGVFGTWMTISLVEEFSLSGWDLAQGTMATGGLSYKLPYFALVGGILAVVGSVLGLVKPGTVARVLLAIGGILALIGVANGLNVADVATAATGVYEASYGTYMVVIGGILAILSTLGLEEEPYRAEG